MLSGGQILSSEMCLFWTEHNTKTLRYTSLQLWFIKKNVILILSFEKYHCSESFRAIVVVLLKSSVDLWHVSER